MALGHDLGHVPFAHSGERHLNTICIKYNIGYFCHNAQSVKQLMELEKNGLGLNLNVQTLDGILCHNGEMLLEEYRPNFNKNKEQFLDEYKNCYKIKDYSKIIRPMTLEGCVVRISDIIAYIGRDIEDSILLGVIKRNDIPSDVQKGLGNNNKDIVNSLIIDVIKNSIGKDYISYSKEKFALLKKLMQFNYDKIYKSSDRNFKEDEIYPMFEKLFLNYVYEIENDKINDKNLYDFVHMNDNKYLEKTDIKRIAVDYISGQTDNFFISECKKIGMTL